MVTKIEYVRFKEAFYRKEFPHERFGQAFMNHFRISGPDAEVFYEQDDRKARLIILERYVDSTSRPL